MKHYVWIIVVAALITTPMAKPMAQRATPETQINLKSIINLPGYTIEDLCRYLSLKDITRLKRVCRYLNQTAWDSKRMLLITEKDIVAIIPAIFGFSKDTLLGSIPPKIVAVGIMKLCEKSRQWENPLELCLNCQALTELPAEIGTMARIKKLGLSYNAFTPETIADFCDLLSNLEELNIAKNALKEVPIEISKLERLKCLDLSFNYLPQDAIGDLCIWLPNLETLKLRWSKLTELPEETSNLRRLKILDISHNQLTEAALANLYNWLPNTTIIL